MDMEILEQKSLAYKDANSDKVYHLQLVKVENGYKVNYQNGKRGNTLTNGTRTKEAVSFEEAEKLYRSILKKKMSEGYSEGESGAVFQSKDLEERFTGLVPQLLNKAKSSEIYLEDDDYFMQEKYNGVRRMVKIEGAEVVSINKKGLEVLSPQSVIDNILTLKKDITVDGELIGERYCIFDILFLDGKDLRELGAEERYNILKGTGLKGVIPSYFGKEKMAAFADLSKKENKKEGVVYKKRQSAYVSGRPSSGGNQIKDKFYATDTFEVVKKHKTKRSVNIVSYTEDGKAYDMGNITIPVNFEIPEVGAFIEVRYLYCHVGGKLFQTIYLGQRNDQDRSDCHMREIKFMEAPIEEDDEE